MEHPFGTWVLSRRGNARPTVVELTKTRIRVFDGCVAGACDPAEWAPMAGRPVPPAVLVTSRPRVIGVRRHVQWFHREHRPSRRSVRGRGMIHVVDGGRLPALTSCTGSSMRGIQASSRLRAQPGRIEQVWRRTVRGIRFLGHNIVGRPTKSRPPREERSHPNPGAQPWEDSWRSNARCTQIGRAHV